MAGDDSFEVPFRDGFDVPLHSLFVASSRPHKLFMRIRPRVEGLGKNGEGCFIGFRVLFFRRQIEQQVRSNEGLRILVEEGDFFRPETLEETPLDVVLKSILRVRGIFPPRSVEFNVFALVLLDRLFDSNQFSVRIRFFELPEVHVVSLVGSDDKLYRPQLVDLGLGLCFERSRGQNPDTPITEFNGGRTTTEGNDPESTEWLGEDPNVLRDFSDDSFAHGYSLWFAGVCAEVFGVQTGAVIYQVVSKAALLCAGR